MRLSCLQDPIWQEKGYEMSLYAIGDLHLSQSTHKPMDIFGPAWSHHVSRLQEGFQALGPEDVCVLCGDTSWGSTLEEALADFQFLDTLPGRKILLKGNHDYWWTGMGKMQGFLRNHDITSVSFLHNNAVPYGEKIALCGTKGWFYEPGRSSAHDRKLMDREILRLEASLKAAEGRERYVFLHFPPRYGSYACQEILALLRLYQVRMCCSGHLHGASLAMAFNGLWEGCLHRCVSADAIQFRPCKIL